MQNKQSLVRVVEWLENGAPHVTIENVRVIDQFDMEYGIFDDGCGTACCIAGAVVQFEGLGELKRGEIEFFDITNFKDNVIEKGISTLAAEHLGITQSEAEQLFEPWAKFEYSEHEEFSHPKRAAAVIRHFLAEGVVDWDLFDKDGIRVYQIVLNSIDT